MLRSAEIFCSLLNQYQIGNTELYRPKIQGYSQQSRFDLLKKRKLISPMSLLWQLGFSDLVISAGMPRSASTLMFNYLRIILESECEGDFASGWIEDVGELDGKKMLLLKVHDVNRVLAIRASHIFYSYRDIRDALVSQSRKFGSKPSLEKVKSWIEQYEFAERYADDMFRYDELISSPKTVISSMTNTLGINVSADEVLKKLSKELVEYNQRFPNSGAYSKSTLLHENHRTYTEDGEWKNILDKDFLEKLMRQFGWWFERAGFHQ
jgi:hypothetical protein